MMQPQSCPTVAIQCEINGKPYSYAVSPTMSLLHFLRGQGLISVKEGCSVGECGACTVRVDGTAIDSCLYLAVWADGKSIRTVEGERQGNELSDVQQAFIDEGAVQCGFCTPGLVMASAALLDKTERRPLSEAEIRRGLSGNLCRCTGYQNVVRAVKKCCKG
ncbi:TPA: xanthine dehydrogenase iron sulfur-binding subunit XdhC [Aeromonas hydrophila]|jgi:xanthine dehydrogenase iron-sulfur-binding subunit|uniref:xanthine dehydrogenase iron sulfur-binding subunit XdhC n=1 Tax=Aeromonas TaxID=642 RepID=UPI000909C20A|nr:MULTISPECIES: xanthine dehydrogenase iron sulfur-binding subunit XdhC [Aeromonas]HEB5077924.1 xanthine dehydrogenase iron sulfur-binding subunit XdhC [Aeromonas hydrophila subsp. hydrophila]APJ15552.1 xanthine dehydrogenase [Aeromonas hydrophila]MBQ4677058.1 xanthine dehydrogenase iron sulfur-binding subunit XdhC [Aeromonas hydrophila]MBW3813661.1 xanthine dehydrogenase iron sulfur-binding subunit XdhC [Aeromonas hydrophila]MCF7678891.1 xanthine dehydrogenase iron sulfur-binding subunit Xdh